VIIEETWTGKSGETLHLWNGHALMQKYANSLDSSAEELRGRELERKMIESACEWLHPGEILVKDDFGKPYWKNREIAMPHMNYSHTKDLLFWGEHNSQRIGVDIEHEREQLLRIKHKFCTAEELQFCQDNIQQILLVWSAKEAMYKAYGQKEIDFKEQMNVWDFEHLQGEQTGQFKGQLQVDGTSIEFEIEFRRKSPYLLTWTLLNHP
jgi:phosphopantetheinyl transferase